MTPVRINENNIFSVLVVICVIVLITLAIMSFIFASLKFAGSVVLGGVLATANFIWLQNALQRILNLPVDKAGRFAQIRFILRLSVLAFLVWLLIVYVGIDSLGLIVGLSVVVISILVLTVYNIILKGG